MLLFFKNDAQNLEINYKDIIVYTCLIGPNEGLNPQPQIRNSKLRHVCLKHQIH